MNKASAMAVVLWIVKPFGGPPLHIEASSCVAFPRSDWGAQMVFEGRCTVFDGETPFGTTVFAGRVEWVVKEPAIKQESKGGDKSTAHEKAHAAIGGKDEKENG